MTTVTTNMVVIGYSLAMDRRRTGMSAATLAMIGATCGMTIATRDDITSAAIMRVPMRDMMRVIGAIATMITLTVTDWIRIESNSLSYGHLAINHGGET